MKRIMGIVLLVFGLLIVSIGVYVMTFYSAKKGFYMDQMINDLNTQSDLNRDITIGFFFLVCGLVAFISGLFLTTAKTNKHKNLEVALNFLKIKPKTL